MKRKEKGIPKGYTAIFHTLIKAANNGDVALLECQDAKTLKPAYVIVALNRRDDGLVEFVPFARLFDGNPYEELNPPNPDGGFYTQDEVWGKEGAA